MGVKEASAAYTLTTEATCPLGYKRTEVGLIPEDWAAKYLSEVARGIYRGASPRPIDDPVWFDQNSSISWVRISDVTKSGRFLTETTQRLSQQGVKHSRYVPKGSLIMSICATVGRPIETGIEVCIHDGFVIFERLNVEQGFLYHVLKELEPRWSDKGQTGSQMNLNTGLIKSTQIALPPTKSEQEAIAVALSDTDALIEVLEQRIAKQRQIKQGAMQTLLTGQQRLSGFTGEWHEKRFDELGYWIGGMTPSMSNPLYWQQATVPWISSGDVKSARLTVTKHRISRLALKEHATTLVPEKSVIIVMRSGILRKRLPVAMNMVPMAINQDVKALIPDSGICAEFMLHSLAGHAETILARCLKSGTTVESIEFRWLKAFAILLPPHSEQTAIAQVLSDMDAEITALEQRLTKTRAIKQGMMQQLLTGRIRLI